MGWYNASWINRIAITVDHTKVGASLTNFPVYLDLSTLPASFFSNVRSDGGDIRMTESDGTTELAREIVAIDTVGKTGEVHFNAPTLSNSADTVFYIYYNDPSATDYAANATYGAQNVWDSNFVGVFHLQANGNDSTSNANNLTNNNSVAFNASKIGKGADFGASNTTKDLTTTSNMGITDGNITITGWFTNTTLPTSGTSNIFAGHVDAATTHVGTRLFLLNSGGVYTFYSRRTKFGVTNVDSTKVFTPTTGVGYKLTSTYDGSNITLIFNGVAQTPTAISGDGTSGGGATGFDISNTPDGYGFMSGLADEVRVSKIVRATTWDLTEYNNQNSSSTFYTIGGQEIQSTGGIHGTLSMMGVGN